MRRRRRGLTKRNWTRLFVDIHVAKHRLHPGDALASGATITRDALASRLPRGRNARGPFELLTTAPVLGPSSGDELGGF